MNNKKTWILELYFTENLNQNMDVLYLYAFFLTVTKIYDYILNIWTDSLLKCQMLRGKNSFARECLGFCRETWEAARITKA